MQRGEAAGYNAGMGQVDKWLLEGGRVVAASDRAARAVLAAYHRGRRAEGLTAWVAPAVQAWGRFVEDEWLRRCIGERQDGRLVLNPLQEEALWVRVIARSGHGAALLDGPLRRLAGLAMEAHALLCGYAPRFLESGARRTWQQDAGAFSDWLREMDAACAAHEVVSAARVAVELRELLKADTEERAPLLLVGFDRVTPVQREVLDAWGEWSVAESAAAAEDVAYFAAQDAKAELAACAAWCKRELEENAGARLLVVTQDVKLRRGEIERAFLREGVEFEFSLGVPLGSVALVRSALLMLRWLDGELEEREMDWLFSSLWVGSAEERAGLQRAHREVRRKNRERTEWALTTWMRERGVPESWMKRMEAARELLRASAKRMAPVEWCALTPRLLEAMGWPGAQSGSQTTASADYQAVRRWEQALDACGSLGFDGRRLEWREFLKELSNAAETTLFAAESEEAPVLIAGPAESAGLAADAIWFAGVDEDAWPQRGALHPLIPADVQKTAGMPHATAQLDAELAATITDRLLGSAAKARFSYARQKDGVEARTSRLVTQLTGEARAVPAERVAAELRTEIVRDAGCIPLRVITQGDVHGGSAVLTAQSVCPFQAFATARLDARRWDAAEAGLTALMRGNLLHEVMHAIWGGAGTGGIRTSDELMRIADQAKELEAFVAEHVRRVMREKVPAGVRERMPERYLELEAMRLTQLVHEWMEYEAARLPFSVKNTEVDSQVAIEGLTLRLRLDRVDELQDGSLLVIDYKTGDVSPKQWEMPRAEDVQLPLYAGFALPEGSELGGLAFAKLRAGQSEFAGCVGDAKSTLFEALKGTSGLVKNALTAEKLIAWRDNIEQLARDFLAGKAEVDPRDFPKTCANCRLQTVCRVYEQNAALHGESEEEAVYDAG